MPPSLARVLFLLPIFALALPACASAANADDGDDAADALIGGKPGAMAKFPSTVFLKGSCTAAKVAPKTLLTAAHCVFDPVSLEITYRPGTPISITRDPSAGYTDEMVANVYVHPAWISGCTASFCAASSVTAKLDAPDVAVIVLADDDGIPVTPIDPTTLLASEHVSVVGFGCTVGVLQPDTRDVASLKYADTRLAPASSAVHDGSPLVTTDVPEVAGNYTMTLGPGAVKAAAGLCPGDSGGPLFATHQGKLVVVGVNSNYTLAATDLTGLPITNWFTRLDDDSRHQVGAWLLSVGAVGAL